MTPHSGRFLLPVIISTGVVGLSIGLTIPLTSVVLAQRGYSILLVGLNTTLYSLAILISGPFIPAWIQRIGLVRAMWSGALLSGLLVLSLAFSTSIWQWYLLRSIMGIAGALHWVGSEAWINRMADERRRGRIVGAYATLWGMGIACGPLLLQITGVSGSLPFFVGSGIMAGGALPLLVLPKTISAETDQGHPLVFKTIAAAPLAMSSGFVCGLLETAALSLLPLYGLHSGLDTARTLSLVSFFAVGTFLAQPIIGWAADKTPLKVLLTAIAGCTVIAVGMLPLTIHGFIGFVGAFLFLWGGSVGGLYSLGMLHLGRRFSGGGLTAASSMFVMAYTAGMVGGPFLGSICMQIYDPDGFLVMMVVIPLLFIASIHRFK